MGKNPIPENEELRLAKLHEYNILDTLPEESYDQIVELASIICGTPIAVISLVDADRQWFKSIVGLDAKETPRSISFCQHAIMGEDLFEVENALDDDKFKDNPLVTEDPNIRFYAGQPLEVEEGVRIGTLCVIDDKQNKLDNNQKRALKILADEVTTHLKLRQEYNSSKNLDKFFQLSLDFMCIAGVDGFFKKINPMFTEKLGFSNAELLEKPFVQFIHEDDVEPTLNEIDKLSKGATTIDFGNRFRCKDGSYINLSWVCQPDVETGELFAAARDVTEVLKFQEELEEAKNTAELSVKAKDTFLANMSHEIRTPMNAIIGFSDLLQAEKLSSDQQNYVGAIQSSGKLLLNVINDILDISKIESGKLTLVNDAFKLPKLIKDIKSILEQSAKEKGIKLRANIDADIPENLTGDQARLSQVLVNLINNAIKFTEKGSVTLDTELIHQKGNQVKIKFSVIDTGIGIPSDQIENLTERFTQVESEYNRSKGGSGLGLNISQKILELHNSILEIESEVGNGSVFSFVLDMESLDDSQVVHNMEDTTRPDIIKNKSLRILAAEDNLLNQQLIKRVVENFGYNIEIAENGVEAVNSLKNGEFDLVLMDLQMPEMDGYQATTEIRQTLKSDVPIMAMTAHSLAGEATKCFELGMDGYMSKPFNTADLYNQINELINQKDSKSNPSTENQNAESSNTDFLPLYELANNDKGFILQMLALFRDNCPEQLNQIVNALKEEDINTISSVAHSLKSSAGVLGLNEIKNICSFLERNNSITEELQKSIVQLDLEVKQGLEKIDNHIEQIGK